MDEKDRYGDKLHDVERAREEQWAHQRDQELLEKLRKKGEAAQCPECRKPLVAETRAGVAMMACADKHGAWLRAEVLEALLKRLKTVTMTVHIAMVAVPSELEHRCPFGARPIARAGRMP